MIPVKTHSGLVQGDQAGMGYLGVALQVKTYDFRMRTFQCAFHQLLHATSYEQGLVAVLRIGGDTDTNGCITGALLGARFGAESMPDGWKRAVVEAKSRRSQDFGDAALNDIEALVADLIK